MKVWQVILAGVVVHVILFYSIFDIYFTSPLVHGMTPHVSRKSAPAKRLVLFVVDGLRADSFYELESGNSPKAPYLRSVMEERGVWGVSHTRVPTESRPGHVALIAGFYEDVSAVAKGWKENPVEFDSVFNQSRYTWSWGSPDILPMFAKGASGNHVKTRSYPAHFEDFASSDITRLDLWVFLQVQRFFKVARHNDVLMKALQRDKLVFFLHLLGIDTNGHVNKPHSVEYQHNIKVVDEGIHGIVNMLEDFYDHDGKTAFVMTADHGMTNWGSHGAGHPHETLTPFVAWGAGVREPKITYKDCGAFDDNYCEFWDLQHLQRVDISQADVAPLMAFLIGVPFPVNSVGMLPVDYLSVSDYEQAEGLYANAQQILEQYQVKMKQVKDRTLSATFTPFRFPQPERSPLSMGQYLKGSDHVDKDPLRDLTMSAQVNLMRNVKNLISTGYYQDAISECKFIIQTALKGLRYFQTYDRFFLGGSVTLGFLGWMGYVLRLLLAEHTPAVQQTESWGGREGSVLHLIFTAVAFLVALLLYVQSLPWTNYLYCLMPVLLWLKAAEGWGVLKGALRHAVRESSVGSVLIAVTLSLLGLEIAVLTFFHRYLLSVGLVAMAMWALTTPMWKTHQVTSLCWMMSCVLVAIFPQLPVVGRNANYSLVVMSGLVALGLGGYLVWRLWGQSGMDRWSKGVLCLQWALVGTATLLVSLTSARVASKSSLPRTAQLVSWVILCISPLLPLLTGVTIHLRLLSLCLAFLAPYLLMSITYEGLFVLCLMYLLFCWLRMETLLVTPDTRQTGVVLSFKPNPACLDKKEILASSTRHLCIADLRRAFFFIFLILTAFFGTGNIASINSFDPASVYCFLTVFNPFVMGALMMLKVVLPFVGVSCVLKGIQVVTRIPLRALMLIVTLMADVMGLNFFFLVRDEGSWLEIGTSISHYVIVMSMITFVMILMGLSQALTSTSLTARPPPPPRH